jgi:sugar/nucleoside kinase (ribokinase family)
MTYDVYGVGNALVDIQARVADALVQRLQLDKGIMTLVDDTAQAGVLAQLSGAPLNHCAGGSAANTIVALAEMGGSAAFAGKVGSDEIGDFFLNDLRSLGIDYRVPRAQEGQTGTCAILITPDAQRTMLTNLAVSTTLGPEDVDAKIIAKSKYVYVEGYLLTGESTKAAAYRAMELAKQAGVKVAFSASDPFLINLLRGEIWDLITGPVDLFFCNEEEAKSLTGHKDPVQCAAMIHEHAENVALTLGSNGSILMHGGETIPIEGVAAEAIDTTGAGDMYAGALLYGITSGLSWHQAGHLASHAAARIVSQLGARLEDKFTRGEIRDLVNEVR